MSWTQPKTNWEITDYFNLQDDWNRITGNYAYLTDIAYTLYDRFPVEDVPEKTFTSMIYPADWNYVENTLEAINTHTEKLPIGETRTYVGGGNSMDYTELNRVERGQLSLYNAMKRRTDVLVYTGEMSSGDAIGIL